MNREQMVEKAALALGCLDYGRFRCEHTVDAERVVDDLLPQVSTVEELDALPVHAKVIDAKGEAWRAWRWYADTRTFFYSTVPTLGVHEPAELAARGPLTVVWQP